MTCYQANIESPWSCVTPDQLEACEDKLPLSDCTLTSGSSGKCINGLCSYSACGNCRIEGIEVCDDGNTLSGDGCRGDCLAAEWNVARIDTGATFALNRPRALSADDSGNVFVTDEHRLVRIDASGSAAVVAGSAAPGFGGDDGPGSAARLNLPSGLAIDSAGNVLIGDAGNHRLRKLDTEGIIQSLAGAEEGFADGANPLFRAPGGLYLADGSQSLYLADTGNHVVRILDLTSGTAATFVGTPQVRGVYLVDQDMDGKTAADEAALNLPQAVVRCPNGDWFIADTGNNRVLRIAAQGCDPAEPGTCAVTAVLGDTEPASSGEGFPSDIFPVHAPAGLYCDSENNLLVTSTTTVRLLTALEGVVNGRGNVQSLIEDESLDSDEFPCLEITGIVGIDADTVWVTDSCIETGSIVGITRPSPETLTCE